MTAGRTYLDYNASAPLRPEAREAVVAALDVCGNPSSVHAEGRNARAFIEAAREQVAALAGAQASEVVFTSGATESNASVFARDWQTIYLSGIEHPSVLVPAQAHGGMTVDLPAKRDGVVCVEDFAAHVLRSDSEARAMLALQLANNETGVIQPVAEACDFAREHDVFVHCDAVQAAGRIAIDFAALGADTMSLSSHKIGGPKGVGALIIRDGVSLPAFLTGGGQEKRRRGGTENVAAIAGFGAAAEAARRDLADQARISALRDEIASAVLSITPEAMVIGGQAERLSNTVCIAWPGRIAETLVIKLDLMGIAISAGAACSSGKVSQSAVLSAMGFGDALASSAIRISLGHATTQTDCKVFIDAWRTIASADERKRTQRNTQDAARTGGPLHQLSGVH